MRRCAMPDRQLEATLEHERGLELLGYAQWLAERDGPDRESARRWLAQHGYSRTVDAGRAIVYRRNDQRAV